MNERTLVGRSSEQRASNRRRARRRSLALMFLPILGACHAARPAAGDATHPRATWTIDEGGVVRGPRDRKRLALLFTGGDFGEGTDAILDALHDRHVHASFFVTGGFLRRPEHAPLLRRIVAEGHYLGPHSDAHLLYCDWDDRDRLLVTNAQFAADLERNLADIEAFGVRRAAMRYFVPPYEWYNRRVAEWTKDLGLTLVTFTPGTRSNADYRPDDDPRFVSSQAIFDSILAFEATQPDGLNGFLLLMHMGSGPARTDKMHPYVGPLIDELQQRGYLFERVDELLAPPPR